MKICKNLKEGQKLLISIVFFFLVIIIYFVAGWCILTKHYDILIDISIGIGVILVISLFIKQCYNDAKLKN